MLSLMLGYCAAVFTGSHAVTKLIFLFCGSDTCKLRLRAREQISERLVMPQGAIDIQTSRLSERTGLVEGNTYSKSL